MKHDPERRKKDLTISEDEMEENWDTVFKRNWKNEEKNRYKRGQRNHNKGE